MNIKEYLRLKITPGKQPDLELIYKDLINCGYLPTLIYTEINEVILENINKITKEYLENE